MPKQTLKLTDTQRVILAQAAQRDDGAVLPLPASLTRNAGATRTVLQSLLKKGLVEERPTTPGSETWRDDEDGGRLTLVITDAGLAAIGVEDSQDDNTRPKAPPAKTSRPKNKAKVNGKAAATKSRSRSKSATQAKGKPSRKAAIAKPEKRSTRQSQLIDLMQRKSGATIAELMAATGWQAHSVRGAISGSLKKKLGLPVTSAVIIGRGRVYRIVG